MVSTGIKDSYTASWLSVIRIGPEKTDHLISAQSIECLKFSGSLLLTLSIPDPLKPEDRQKLADKEAAAQEAGQPSTHDMKDEDREFLQNFFHPYNQRLAEVLEDEGYTWGY